MLWDYTDIGAGCWYGTQMTSDLVKGYWYKVSVPKTCNKSELANFPTEKFHRIILLWSNGGGHKEGLTV